MDFVNQYPELMALATLVAGFIFAHLGRRLTQDSMQLLERGIGRMAPQRGQMWSDRARKMIGEAAYFIVLFFFILVAIQMLRLQILGEWIDGLIVFMPQFVLGGVIIISGIVLGRITRGLLSGLEVVRGDPLIPQVAQAIIILAAVITGLGQMEVNVSFLANAAIVVLSVAFGGLTLSFVLGSKEIIANKLARRELHQYRVGDRIRIDDVEGTIVEMTGTTVDIENSSGITSIPAQRFITSIVQRLTGDSG